MLDFRLPGAVPLLVAVHLRYIGTALAELAVRLPTCFSTGAVILLYYSDVRAMCSQTQCCVSAVIV